MESGTKQNKLSGKGAQKSNKETVKKEKNNASVDKEKKKITPLVTDSNLKENKVIFKNLNLFDNSRRVDTDNQCKISENQHDLNMKHQEISKQSQNITDFEEDLLTNQQDNIQDNLLPSEDTVQENLNKMKKNNLQSQTITLDHQKPEEQAASLKPSEMANQLHLKAKHKISEINVNKISNRAMVVYILLALVFGTILMYIISTLSDNKSMKIQLNIAQTTIEDLNIRVRTITAEKIKFQDQFQEILTRNSDNTYHAEMSRITSERDSLKIKLQEADYQLKHLQTKLDQALTEKNYLQAHASEANPLINIHSPDESKDKNGYSNWIISLQSLVGYIQYMPAYFLFSFQITFLNLMCSILFRDKLSPILLKLKYVNPRVSELLYFFCCVLGYPISCELIGFLGWMTGFSVSKRNMASIPSPIGLMVRSGSDIVSDWVFKDNALLLWLLCIFIGGIITFISHMWYHALSKRLKDNGFEKRHILLTMIFTLVLLNQCLYRIFSWFTGVTMGPRTYINWLGARKAVSSLLSILIYSLAALFTLRLFHVNMPNLIRNVFRMSQKLFFNAKSKSAK